MKPFIYKMVLPLICTISLVGCGGDKAESTTSSEVTAKKSNAQTENKTKNTDSTPDGDAMVVKVAMTANYAPYGFLDEYGKPIGYNVDFIRAIGKEEGFKTEFVVVPWLKFADSLISGETDVGFSTGAVGTDEQKSKFLLSDPYLRNAIGYGVKSDSSNFKMEDLNGKVVSTQKGTKYIQLLANYQPNAKVLAENTTYLAYANLMNNKAEATLADESLILYQSTMFPEQAVRFFPMKEAGLSEHLAFSASDNKEEIVNKINDGFQKIKANGKYDEINKKWFGNRAKQLAVNYTNP